MGDLIPSGGGFVPSRIERAAGREIASVRARQAVVTARETAKLEVISDVTESAMLSANRVSAIEAMLAQQNPAAAGRLAAIGDVGAMGLAEVVMRTARTVR